jgi:uncharacterized protein DUF3520/protein with von Willebrand factor-like domain
MNIDDAKLTAYALDELDAAERSAIARAIADSPEAQRFVADTQQFAHALRSQYAFELQTELVAREKIMAIYDEPFWSKAGPLAIAAVLAVLAVIGAVALGTNRSAGIPTLAGSSSSREAAGARPTAKQFAPIEAEDAAQANQNPSREADAGPYAYTGERPFVSALSRSRSSVPLLVSSGSYLDVRRSITAGVLPTREAVRIEGMINYFAYEYPQPIGHESFSLNVEVVACPWEPTHRLVRVGLKGRDAVAVMRDSRVEIEFNPRRVASYRLIGYDRQPSERQNLSQEKVSSERIAAGYTLTALYEAVLLRQKGATADAQIPAVTEQPEDYLLSAKLQLGIPSNDAIRSIERVVTDKGSGFVDAPQDLKFVAAVAEFAMILRGSEYKGNGTLEKVLEWAQEGKGADIDGHRADFIELVRKAQGLKRG